MVRPPRSITKAEPLRNISRANRKTPDVGLGDHATIDGFDFRRLPTHHRDSEAARDLLRAGGVQNKVGGFDRAARYCAPRLRCTERSAPSANMAGKSSPED